MNITQLVFAWPREAQYSCEPDTYTGWAIEDYSLEISGIPLQVGDVRHWEAKAWRVAKVDHYSPQGETSVAFNEAVLTLEGDRPQRDPWQPDDARLMYVCVSGEDFVFGWPQRSEFFPKMGSEVPQLEGWEVSSIQAFEGTVPDQHYYAQVLLCWCAPMGAVASQAVAVSA
ncbi:MAG: hypothetical protein AAFN08_05575 [Cyanobacteria bacterium J06559_3]